MQAGKSSIQFEHPPIRIENCMTPLILPVMHQSPGQCFKWAE